MLSRAATPYASVHAGSGALAGGAKLQSSLSSSSGQYVQFGSSPAVNASTLGFYDGNHNWTTIQTIANWLGGNSAVPYALEFTDATSWSTISNPSWFMSQWSGAPFTMIWAIPMLPCGAPNTTCAPNNQNYNALASGTDNSYFVNAAKVLVGAGQGSAYIRLGWEFNGTWFPWNVCNSTGAADFVKGFQNIVTSMRSVPGANFKFIWNPDDSTGDCGVKLENFYPGDAYVNVVALDAYDTLGVSSTPQQRWNGLLNGTNVNNWAPVAPNAINGQAFTGYGLSWLAAFAKEHSKQVGIPEWGLWNDGSSDSSGDDTYYINQMSEWIKQNASGPTDYWNYGSSALTIPGESSGNSPNATAAFKSDFGL